MKATCPGLRIILFLPQLPGSPFSQVHKKQKIEMRGSVGTEHGVLGSGVVLLGRVPSTGSPPALVPRWEQRLPAEEPGHSKHGIQAALTSQWCPGKAMVTKRLIRDPVTPPPGGEYGLQLGLS